MKSNVSNNSIVVESTQDKNLPSGVKISQAGPATGDDNPLIVTNTSNIAKCLLKGHTRTYDDIKATSIVVKTSLLSSSCQFHVNTSVLQDIAYMICSPRSFTTVVKLKILRFYE